MRLSGHARQSRQVSAVARTVPVDDDTMRYTAAPAR
jgi:hypothetical protein